MTGNWNEWNYVVASTATWVQLIYIWATFSYCKYIDIAYTVANDIEWEWETHWHPQRRLAQRSYCNRQLATCNRQLATEEAAARTRIYLNKTWLQNGLISLSFAGHLCVLPLPDARISQSQSQSQSQSRCHCHLHCHIAHGERLHLHLQTTDSVRYDWHPAARTFGLPQCLRSPAQFI